MKEFFKNQLETLYTRTGFRQLENMMQRQGSDDGGPLWEQDVRQLINFMVEECEKPPFDSVPTTIKQRVIARAVTEDPEFTGLNAKFVRRALSKWWQDNGDRILEQLNKPKEVPYQPLTPEQHEKVNVMLESYRRRLLSEGSMSVVPKMKPEEIKKEGAEWKSELERKAVSVGYKPAMTAEDISARELHMRYIRENYNARTGRPLQTWIPENEWLEKQKDL